MPPETTSEIPAPSSPLEVAKYLIGTSFTDRTTNLPSLRRWRGGWWIWQRSHWTELDPEAARKRLYDALASATYYDPNAYGKDKPGSLAWNPTSHKITNVIDALTSVAYTESTIDAPSWVGPTDVPVGTVVACGNGLLHVHSGTFHDLTPAYFNEVAVPFDYDPDAPAPARWLKFLGQLWPDDQESINALQEWFGYVISGRTDMHKIMLMIGPTRSGKGTIGRVLEALVGRGSVAGPTLAGLASQFGLETLIGKPLALVADARLKRDQDVVVERLLTISGEDTLQIDRKFKTPWNGKLPSRITIMSNEIPRFGDAAGAISNRMIVLSMTRSFLHSEDHALTGKLLAELPGIFVWALEGLARLDREGQFTTPDASRMAIQILQDSASPMAAFVRDECVTGAESSVTKDALYTEWKRWCDDNGNAPGSTATFAKNLFAVVPTVKSVRGKVDGQRYQRFDGIRLFDPTMDDTPDLPDPARISGVPNPDPRTDPAPVESKLGQGGQGGQGDPPLWALQETNVSACRVCGEELHELLVRAGLDHHEFCVDEVAS